MEEDDLLTSNQAAALAGITYDAWANAVAYWHIPYQLRDDPALRQSGGRPVRLFARSDVLAYIEQRAIRSNRAVRSNAERVRAYQQRKKQS